MITSIKFRVKGEEGGGRARKGEEGRGRVRKGEEGRGRERKGEEGRGRDGGIVIGIGHGVNGNGFLDNVYGKARQ